jgi:hypothetical protein
MALLYQRAAGMVQSAICQVSHVLVAPFRMRARLEAEIALLAAPVHFVSAA